MLSWRTSLKICASINTLTCSRSCCWWRTVTFLFRFPTSCSKRYLHCLVLTHNYNQLFEKVSPLSRTHWQLQPAVWKGISIVSYSLTITTSCLKRYLHCLVLTHNYSEKQSTKDISVWCPEPPFLASGDWTVDALDEYSKSRTRKPWFRFDCMRSSSKVVSEHAFRE